MSVVISPFHAPRLLLLTKYRRTLVSAKGHVRHDVIATQSPAVLPPALPVKVPDQGRRGIGLPVQTVFCPAVFSHLDHAQVIALDVTGADEPDDILAGEPAVCQHIPEPDPFADGASYHGNHQVGFLCRVFIDTLCKASPLSRPLVKRLASSSSTSRTFHPFLFHPAVQNPEAFGLSRRVTARNKALKRGCTCDGHGENTLPMFSMRRPVLG